MTCKRFIEIALAVLSCTGVAIAASSDDAFKQHYEAGLSHYSSEDYDGAVKEFQTAYAIKPRPRLLFNIGQSYRSLGNAREALRYYLLYQAMESTPKPGLKVELEGYIAQMKAIVEQAERARRAEDHDLPVPPPPGPPAPPAPSDPLNPYAPPPPPTGAAAPAAAVVVAAAPPTPTPVYKRGWFWGVIGGSAAVVLITGLSVGLTVGSGSGYGGDTRHPTF